MNFYEYLSWTIPARDDPIRAEGHRRAQVKPVDALEHTVSAEHVKVVRRPEGKRLHHVCDGYDTPASRLEWEWGGGGRGRTRF